MNLVIHTPLTYAETYNPSISDEEVFDNQEELEEIHKMLDDFSVYHSITNHFSGMALTIYEQKISLDELNMNTLFYYVISRFFNCNTTYMALGGKGCETSFSISCKTTEGD